MAAAHMMYVDYVSSFLCTHMCVCGGGGGGEGGDIALLVYLVLAIRLLLSTPRMWS